MATKRLIETIPWVENYFHIIFEVPVNIFPIWVYAKLIRFDQLEVPYRDSSATTSTYVIRMIHVIQDWKCETWNTPWAWLSRCIWLWVAFAFWDAGEHEHVHLECQWYRICNVAWIFPALGMSFERHCFSNIYLMEYVLLFNLVLLHCHVWVQEGKHESFRLLASEGLGLRTAEPSGAKQPSVIRNCPSTRQYDQYAKECIHLWLNPCLSLFISLSLLFRLVVPNQTKQLWHTNIIGGLSHFWDKKNGSVSKIFHTTVIWAPT